ncbi:MAG: 50S ribosomal protein L5 [Candidatus Nezhaarchaeota archaeon]|nr:50S ribosomal protein L5 [Candidatus Nezhaarchaeota archaeon]
MAGSATENPMRRIKVGKVVVNMAVGTSGEQLMKAAQVLEKLTGQKPCFRKAKRTIKDFGIKKGETIACMVTLRKQKALDFLKRALAAVGFKLKRSCFDPLGNFAFGVKEHISLPGVKYDPALGIFGFDVCVSLERPGYRVKTRRRRRSCVGKKHLVTREEAWGFVERELGVTLVD